MVTEFNTNQKYIQRMARKFSQTCPKNFLSHGIFEHCDVNSRQPVKPSQETLKILSTEDNAADSNFLM